MQRRFVFKMQVAAKDGIDTHSNDLRALVLLGMIKKVNCEEDGSSKEFLSIFT